MFHKKGGDYEEITEDAHYGIDGAGDEAVLCYGADGVDGDSGAEGSGGDNR